MEIKCVSLSVSYMETLVQTIHWIDHTSHLHTIHIPNMCVLGVYTVLLKQLWIAIFTYVLGWLADISLDETYWYLVTFSKYYSQDLHRKLVIFVMIAYTDVEITEKDF